MPKFDVVVHGPRFKLSIELSVADWVRNTTGVYPRDA